MQLVDIKKRCRFYSGAAPSFLPGRSDDDSLDVVGMVDDVTFEKSKQRAALHDEQ